MAGKALRAIAGEDNLAPLAAELCGHDNLAAPNILAKYREVRAAAGERVAKGGDGGDTGGGEEDTAGKTSSLTRIEREWAVNALAFIGQDLGRGKLRGLGFQVGQDLYRSVMDFIASGDAIYSTPGANYPGRKKYKVANGISERWIEMSQVLSRTHSAGGNLRTVLAGKAKAASAIQAEFGCSKATAYKYCPGTVVGTRKHTDLCCYCEALRKARLEYIRVANNMGADLVAPGEFAGQSEVAGPAERAEEYLKNAEGGEEASMILGNLAIFKWHENMAMELTAKMKAEIGQRLVILFDFSGNIPLKSVRGDADEFFRPEKVSLFGMMFIVPRHQAAPVNFYVDIFSFDRDHSSQTAAASLKCGIQKALESEVLSALPREISFYSDKGKHFCSGELLYEILFKVAPPMQSNVAHTFFAPNHGKTRLDSHFAKVKSTIEKIPVGNWSGLTARQAEHLVISSLSTIRNGRGAFLRRKFFPQGHRQKLCIQDISCAQQFYRSTDPQTLIDTLVVENKNVPIRTKTIREWDVASTAESDPEKHLGRVKDSATLLQRLRTQKERQSRYK